MATASVRVIGGTFNGRKINFPFRLARPSGGRVRESLFSCLGACDNLTCLDLFAGSGVLGFSAASRGATRVTLVEKNRRLSASLLRMAESLGASFRVVAAPAERFLKENEERFDLVFLDPPFADYREDADWARLLTALSPHLATSSRVYCEGDRFFEPPGGWRVLTARRVGGVFWQLLSYCDAGTPRR